MYPLKLEYQKSKIDNILCYETIDEDVLNKLINSKLLNEIKWDNGFYQNEKQQLKAYKKIIKNGTASVKYNKIEDIGFGRSNPIKSLGLFSLRRSIRHTLAKNNYTDIDIENCHPNILKQICIQNNIKCENLINYVDNRNSHLNDIINLYNVSRDDAKKLFIRLLYFGSFESWAKELNLKIKPSLFISNFKKEIQEIGKVIYNANDLLQEKLKGRTNIIGSVVSYYLQEIESRILESIYLYCVDNKIIVKNNCVLCADGIMIETVNYKPELLLEFSKLILEKFNFLLTFTTKSLDEDYLNILDDNQLEEFKIYNPLLSVPDIDIINMNNNYIYDDKYTGQQLTQEIFNKYKTIIIKSTTGTGKTSNTARFCKSSKKNILSIITRISLVNQHIDSFKNEGIELYDYRNKNDNVYDKDLVICINSLMMLGNLSVPEMNNYIIYIDEVSSFLESLTHNSNLNKNLKLINNILMKLIKNCHKIIVSDALISDNVFELLKLRQDKIFINNDFKKYTNINAYDVRNEEKFLNMINDRCSKDEYFLFGCDSKKIITKYYEYCLNDNKDKKDKFLLITADSKIEFDNANEAFKGKFVFFSPSMTFGIDFSIDVPQDVFIYIKGNSILPSGSFQQTTRTRNIKDLYFFVDDKKMVSKYDSLDEVKKYYNEFITESEQLLLMSSYIDEDDKLKIINNSFFDLFCYNEYVKDIYETSKYLHYKEILKQNNFNIINSDDKKEKLNKTIKNEMNELGNISELLESYMKDDDKDNKKYSTIKNFKELFGTDDNELKNYTDYIGNSYKINDVLNFNRFIKKDTVIDAKLKDFDENTYSVKGIDNIYYKIRFINKIFDNNKIDHFDINKINEIKMNDTEFNFSKKLFRSIKNKPTNKQGFQKMAVDWYKNLFGSDFIAVDTHKERNKGKLERVYAYKINQDIVNKYISITKNLNKKDTKDIYMKQFNMKINEENNLFID